MNAGGVQNSPVAPRAEGATQPSQQLTLHPPGSDTVAVGNVPLQEWDALSIPHPQRARQIVANPTTKGLEKELGEIRDKFILKRHLEGRSLSPCQIKGFRQRYRKQRKEAFDYYGVSDEGVPMKDWDDFGIPRPDARMAREQERSRGGQFGSAAHGPEHLVAESPSTTRSS